MKTSPIPEPRQHLLTAAPGDWVFVILLVLITLLAYAPVWNAGFIWDDDEYVTRNPLLTSSDGLRKIWFSLDSPSQYFPLTYTTFYIERVLWGLSPRHFHLANLFLHAANAVLVWLLLTRLRIPGAWLAAALFALHPVQVESVAWITERKNILMGFFYLLSLLCWWKFLQDNRWKRYVLALLFFILALFAKTTACTLPVAMLLVLRLNKTLINRKRLGQILPFVVAGLCMGLMTIWWERFHQGAQGKMFEIGVRDRLLIASRAMWFYLGKLIWPVKLTFSYPRWQISAAGATDYFWLAAWGFVTAMVWRARRGFGKSVGAAFLFFAATLAPVSGLIMLYTFRYSFVADHYQYLACLGPISLLVAGAYAVAARFPSHKKAMESIVRTGLLILLGTLTWRQCENYLDAETLWRATIKNNPGSWLAQTDLGLTLLDSGNTSEAIAHLETAASLDPTLADSHHNLGLAYAQNEQPARAMVEYKKALEIEPSAPRTKVNLGVALLQQGKVDEAIEEFRAVQSQHPEIAGAHYNLGIAFLRKNLWAEGAEEFQRTLQLDPANIEACEHLAWLRATAPQAALRNGAEALALAQRAVNSNGPDDAKAQRILAAAFAETGNFAMALSVSRHALEIANSEGNGLLAEKLRREIQSFEKSEPARNPW